MAFGADLYDNEEDYRDYLRGTEPPPFGPSVVIRRRRRFGAEVSSARPVQSVRDKPKATAEEMEARVWPPSCLLGLCRVADHLDLEGSFPALPTK